VTLRREEVVVERLAPHDQANSESADPAERG
jgi:hypothetical protein